MTVVRTGENYSEDDSEDVGEVFLWGYVSMARTILKTLARTSKDYGHDNSSDYGKNKWSKDNIEDAGEDKWRSEDNSEDDGVIP